jgi:CheY-like chemotaxis protein
MYTYGEFAPDLHLIAIGLVVWVVAVSIAFGVYIPALRTDGKLLRGFAPSRRRANLPAYVPVALRVVEDLDHAALSVGAETPLKPVIHEAVVLEPVIHQPVVLAPVLQVADSAPAPAPCEHPEAFSVLIVDDNTINRQVLELILDSVGVAHASVENGLQAVEAMEACAYDAVLMDLQMPVMDGFEATRRIRALETARGEAPTRIIVISANCGADDMAASLAAGGDAHLAKPISSAAVVAELAACAAVDRLAA